MSMRVVLFCITLCMSINLPGQQIEKYDSANLYYLSFNSLYPIKVTQELATVLCDSFYQLNKTEMKALYNIIKRAQLKKYIGPGMKNEYALDTRLVVELYEHGKPSGRLTMSYNLLKDANGNHFTVTRKCRYNIVRFLTVLCRQKKKTANPYFKEE